MGGNNSGGMNLNSNSRADFFQKIRDALGRSDGLKVTPVPESNTDGARVDLVLENMQDKRDVLFDQFENSARKIGWQVFKAASDQHAVDYIQDLVTALQARLIVRSSHLVIDRLGLDVAFGHPDVTMSLIASGELYDVTQIQSLREDLIDADVGITGVDYAIAETGSVLLSAGTGRSRLVSLLPPVHVAVVERGQVVEDLDDLFTLVIAAHKDTSYMNIISGPSRSADIEQTIITGIHGPKEVHLVLLS